MKKFSKVCLGGTFDQIHLGHKSLLKKAFWISNEVVIGLTTDRKAKETRSIGKLRMYVERYNSLVSYISDNFKGKYGIVELNDKWGPGIFDKDLEGIIVSEETEDVAFELNKKRKYKNLKELEIITIPLILGEDGKKISSTRIRNGEIDVAGHQA